MEYYELNYNNKFKSLSDIELFEEYQKYGGLPEVLESEDIKYKYQIIKWSYQDTLNQNIYKLYYKDFGKTLMKYLIETLGEEFHPRIFQKFVNHESGGYFHIFNLSYELLTYYLYMLSKTELIEVCGDIDLVNNDFVWQDHKYYVPDSSFYQLCPYSKLNSKEMLESLVFTEFLRRNFKVSRGVLDCDEITFVHNNFHKGRIFIQVEKTLSDETIRKNTFNKLNQFDGGKYVISMDTADYSEKDITHVNIIDFLKDDKLITGNGD